MCVNFHISLVLSGSKTNAYGVPTSVAFLEYEHEEHVQHVLYYLNGNATQLLGPGVLMAITHILSMEVVRIFSESQGAYYAVMRSDSLAIL